MKQLSILEMESVNAGSAKQVIDIIDGACGVAGVIAVFGGPVGWGAGAFCAGWGLGHVLFD